MRVWKRRDIRIFYIYNPIEWANNAIPWISGRPHIIWNISPKIMHHFNFPPHYYFLLEVIYSHPFFVIYSLIFCCSIPHLRELFSTRMTLISGQTAFTLLRATITHRKGKLFSNTFLGIELTWYWTIQRELRWRDHECSEGWLFMLSTINVRIGQHYVKDRVYLRICDISHIAKKRIYMFQRPPSWQ